MGEIFELEPLLENFVANWKSHGAKVKGYATVLYGQFILIMADETATTVGGCSTDSSVHVIKAIEEMTGGTFTITNGGVYGSLLSTPIINPPQTAILGMHSIQQRPVVVDGEIVIRPIMNLALSYDHRLIDGKDAVRFLVAIKQLIEDPAKILLEI